jgi:hypothetical protein
MQKRWKKLLQVALIRLAKPSTFCTAKRITLAVFASHTAPKHTQATPWRQVTSAPARAPAPAAALRPSAWPGAVVVRAPSSPRLKASLADISCRDEEEERKHSSTARSMRRGGRLARRRSRCRRGDMARRGTGEWIIANYWGGAEEMRRRRRPALIRRSTSSWVALAKSGTLASCLLISAWGHWRKRARQSRNSIIMWYTFRFGLPASVMHIGQLPAVVSVYSLRFPQTSVVFASKAAILTKYININIYGTKLISLARYLYLVFL